jgi:RNA polymerase sigma factor (sigma-70 family)
VRRLVRALGRNPHPSVADADLLERFVSQRDESAFELLVWRHERMVHGVCRRMLGCEQDVEDACQATFLVLACKAGSIGKRQALGGWLYKVAFRIALRLQQDVRKRGRRERGPDGLDDVPARVTADRNDLRSVLDEEVRRLPEKYRTPVVLCYLEGLTNEAAASQLGCPTGTVVTWLARARQRLRSRLERRGVALPAGGVAALFATSEGGALAPPAFLQPTVKASLLFARDRSAAGVVSPRVALLTKGALHAMFMDRLKIAAILLLVVCLAGARPGILAYERLNSPEPPANQQATTAPILGGGLQERAVVAPVAELGKEKSKQQERKSNQAKVEEVITKTFRTGEAPSVVVEVFNGPIEIVADAVGKVDARLTKQSEANTEEEAKAGLKNIDVQMAEEKGLAVRITARRVDKDRRGNESVAAVLHVPAGAVLDLRTSNGPVSLKGGKGKAQLRTSNGAVTVTGGKGALDLHTSNGDVHMEADKAVAKVQTSNGAVHFLGTLANGEHSFSTSNGPIQITLPKDAHFQVDAQTSNGRIVDEFTPGKVKGRSPRIQHTVGEHPQVSIRLRTSNGTIQIHKKQ